jgi:hypothetical protein
MKSAVARRRAAHGKNDSPDRQEDTPEDGNQGQTLPLRQVPKKKSQANQDSCSLVLSELRQATIIRPDERNAGLDENGS